MNSSTNHAVALGLEQEAGFLSRHQMVIQIEGVGHVVIGRAGKPGADRMAEERNLEGCRVIGQLDGGQVARPTGFCLALLREFGQKMDDGRFGAFRDADEGRPFAKFGLAA